MILAAQTKLSALLDVRVPVWSLTSAPIVGGEALACAGHGTAVSNGTTVSTATAMSQAAEKAFGAGRGRVMAVVGSALFGRIGTSFGSVEPSAVKSIPFATRARGRGIAALNSLVGRSRRT